MQQGSLTPSDVAELYELLKTEAGDEGATPAAPAQALASGDTPGPHEEAEHVILTSMHDLANVNALVSDQTLLFAHQGLSVFYGQNGAGKSGYSRVLKRACRAREAKERILPNVFAEVPSTAPAKAQFELVVDEVRHSEKWVSGAEAPGLLRSIAVFDSKCGRLYVDDENSVVFLPYGLDVLPQLAALCGSLRTEIDRDMETHRASFAPLMDVDSTTVVGKLIADIDGATSVENVQGVHALDEAETAELSRLQRQLGELKASDPIARAAALTNKVQRVGRLGTIVGSLQDAVSLRRVNELRRLSSDALAAREAASLASREAFSEEVVAGTGSNAWKSLFEAAREFSLAEAYPDEPFPFVGDGSRCVLCQQVLTEEAKDRLVRFTRFVSESASRSAAQAEAALATAVDVLTRLDFAPHATDSTLLSDLEEADEQLCQRVKEHLTLLLHRSSAMIKAAGDGTWSEIPRPLPSTERSIRALGVQLREEANQVTESSRPGERERLEKGVAELAGRASLERHRASLVKYLCLRECREQTNPRKISEQQGRLMEQAVTEELRAALAAELVALGLTNIRFNLRKKMREGVTYHQLELADAAPVNANLSHVLSEGEQCVVALASFLAEVRVNPATSGLVFDDPVCSLDQDWRAKIAERLATEATHRQVVVFTHDIVFLLALYDEAATNRAPIHVQTISRSGDVVGKCENEVPWEAGSVRSRLGLLKNLAEDWSRAQRDQRPGDSSRIVAEFYSKLRAAWEQAVEELVFKSVIQRFRKSVQTQSLRYVTFDKHDYLALTRAMAKCSDRTDAHDTGPGRQLGPVTRAELNEDIDNLVKFRDDLAKKQKSVEEERKSLLEPPAAVVG